MNFHSSLNNVRKKTGPANLSVPDDFKQNCHLSNRDLKALYGVSDKTLARWRKIANLPANSGRNAANAARARWGGVLVKDLPPPVDFKDIAPCHVNRVLSEKYGVSETTISRWRKETGTQSSIKAYVIAALPKQGVPPPPPGIASEACQHLRMTHRPVYDRAIVEDKSFKGASDQFVVGHHKFDESALIEYARAKGFKTSAENLAAFDKYD